MTTKPIHTETSGPMTVKQAEAELRHRRHNAKIARAQAKRFPAPSAAMLIKQAEIDEAEARMIEAALIAHVSQTSEWHEDETEA